MRRRAPGPWLREACLFGLVMGLFVAGGCGYNTGFELGEGRTVGAEIFDNKGKMPDLERDLDIQLKNSINRMVHATVVKPSRADYVVKGAILDYSNRGGIRSSTNELLETGVIITVQARLVRVAGPAAGPVPDDDGAVAADSDRPGSPNEAGEIVIREGTYIAESGFKVTEFDGEVRATQRVLRLLADQIALDLFGTLAYEGGN